MDLQLRVNDTSSLTTGKAAILTIKLTKRIRFLIAISMETSLQEVSSGNYLMQFSKQLITIFFPQWVDQLFPLR